MKNKKTIISLAAALGLIVLLSFSVSALFIAVLLGLLLIPPLLLFVSVFVAGMPMLADALESGRERFVISLSEKSIVLEPNVNR